MIFFYGLVGVVVFVDQLTKFLALRYLSETSSVIAIPGILDLTLVRNSGVAFGLFSGYTSILFTFITLSLVALFIIANRTHHEAKPQTRWALSLILGGALGNWIDRIRFAAVIDFIDFRVWPVFNLADTAITIGVAFFILELFKPEKKA